MCGDFVITIANNDIVSIAQSKPSSNVPQAYIVSSVDELPSNAMNGSLAMVKTNTWVFKDVIDYDINIFNVNFVSDNNNYYRISQDGPAQLYYHYYNEEHPPTWVYEEREGWVSDDYKTIRITEEPTDASFITWLKQNATNKSALYLRENGQWILVY